MLIHARAVQAVTDAAGGSRSPTGLVALRGSGRQERGFPVSPQTWEDPTFEPVPRCTRSPRGPPLRHVLLIGPTSQHCAANHSHVNQDIRHASYKVSCGCPYKFTCLTRRGSITSIVPPELLPILSAHISSADHLSPVMFNVPLAIQLHRLIYRSQGGSSTVRSATPPGLESLSLRTGTSSPSASRQANLSNLFWKQKLLCSSLVPTVLNHETQRGSPQHNSILTPLPAISGRRFSANPPTGQPSTAAPCPRPTPVFQSPVISQEASMFSSANKQYGPILAFNVLYMYAFSFCKLCASVSEALCIPTVSIFHTIPT